MHNKVVFKTAQYLQQQFNIPTLRFNFRGVGKSSGKYDDGRGELDDVRFALDFLSRRYPGIPIILAGFSFGAYVGLRAGANDDRVQALISLGTPPHLFSDHEILTGCKKEKLFIHGTLDDIASYEAARAWFEKVPPPKIWRAVNDADHFFAGRMDEVQAILGQFIQSLD
jgi:alpha/beta superfamily hydrolase